MRVGSSLPVTTARLILSMWVLQDSFLLNANYYLGIQRLNDSACAEYIGSYVHGAGNHAPGDSELSHIKLFQ
jgi:hypothetical protein